MIKFLNAKLVQPLLDFLKQGTSPSALAMAVALGFAFGTFPVIGATTALCALFAIIFKLNMAAIQLVNYFLYPLQLLLFLPFIKLGGYFFNTPPFPYSLDKVFEMIQTNLLQTIKELWLANMLGVLAWGITMLPLTFLLYFILKAIFQKIYASFKK